jgi:hypothetical protein
MIIGRGEIHPTGKDGLLVEGLTDGQGQITLQDFQEHSVRVLLPVQDYRGRRTKGDGNFLE